MSSCFNPWLTGADALDAIMAGRGTEEGLAERRRRRLAALLEAAARGSPLYRERLRGARTDSLEGIAPVRKRELMQWSSAAGGRAALASGGLRAFAADRRRSASLMTANS